ncbi:MAG: hypothetical protein ACW99Q_09900 [Candidatus Kariarchaeaceae archaeon]
MGRKTIHVGSTKKKKVAKRGNYYSLGKKSKDNPITNWYTSDCRILNGFFLYIALGIRYQ